MNDDWNTGKLLGISSAYWKGCTLQAAVRLDFFSLLGSESLSSVDLANRAQTDQHATELLLNSLSGMSLLHKDNTLYSNTMFSRKFLCRDQSEYMGHIILHHHHILDGWAQLDSAVRNGGPVKKRSYGEEIERESFLMGMFNLAMGMAPHIADTIDLQKRHHLLDLGGGPGTYAIHFCLANPNLRATIFDRPSTKTFAEKTISRFGLQERISFSGGDFTQDKIYNGSFDVAWLSHILHSNSEMQCLDILKNTRSVMEPGGLIIIHDFILEETKDSPEFGALFSLNMLVNTGVGRSYSAAEISEMMISIGLSSVKHLQIDSPNESSLLMGVV